jgi:redox-sensitive bicupin YhaK (pirin superfamily)
MSFFPGKDPAPGDARSSDAVEQLIVPRSVDLGGFQVHRALPSARSRMVGPFIFFDHFGPAVFKAGDGVDVRPHPHIGLATVTYLFDGEIVHRDSLGTAMPIRPGAVNWMTAGRGIVHSERTAADHRDGGEPLHGLQLWVALPVKDEETAPAFAHTAAADIPELREQRMRLRVVAGTLHGLTAPVVTSWNTIFAEAHLEPGAILPLGAEHEERAVYVISGEIEIGGDRYGAERLLVLKPGDRIDVKAASDGQAGAHVVVVGGAAMDGPRHIWWNFVSSRKDRIEAAKADWKSGRFDLVPGDTAEFIPLPD